MPHDTALIALVAIGFVLARSFGFLATKFRLPPIVGDLLAGLAIGPFTPEFVARAARGAAMATLWGSGIGRR